MRGSFFLALILILFGLVFLVAVARGRAPQLYKALADATKTDKKNGR